MSLLAAQGKLRESTSSQPHGALETWGWSPGRSLTAAGIAVLSPDARLLLLPKALSALAATARTSHCSNLGCEMQWQAPPDALGREHAMDCCTFSLHCPSGRKCPRLFLGLLPSQFGLRGPAHTHSMLPLRSPGRANRAALGPGQGNLVQRPVGPSARHAGRLCLSGFILLSKKQAWVLGWQKWQVYFF